MKKITIKTMTLLATLTLSVGMLSACGKKSSSSTDNTTIAKSSSSKSSSSSSTEDAKEKAKKNTELSVAKNDWLEGVTDEVQDTLYEINDYQRITSATKNMLQQKKDRLAELNITVDNIDGAIGDETLSDVVFVSIVPDESEIARPNPTTHNGEEGTSDITCTFTVWVQTGYTQLTNDRDTDIANAKQVADTLKSQTTSWKKIYYTLTVNDTADGGTLTLDSDKWW